MEQLKFGHRNSSTPSGRSTFRGAKVCGIMGVSCCGQFRIFGSHKISDLTRENCSILNTTPLRLRPAKHRPLHLICPSGQLYPGRPEQKKTPRSTTPGRWQKSNSETTATLPLRWLRGRRRCRPWCWFRSRSRTGRCASLRRIRLIVEFYDVLRNINIGRRKKNRRVLRGSIQDGHISVLAGVAVQYIDHFAADAIEHFGLCRVYVFLVFVLFTLQLPRFGFAFALQARLLVGTEFSAAGIDARTQIVDLLVQAFQLALARRKLRLQFRAGLLAFGSAGNGLAHVNDAEFRSRGRSWRGALRLQCARAENAGSGQECDLICFSHRPRPGQGQNSGIHFFLLLSNRSKSKPAYAGLKLSA